jgi:hypothetical protein
MDYSQGMPDFCDETQYSRSCEDKMKEPEPRDSYDEKQETCEQQSNVVDNFGADLLLGIPQEETEV